MAKPDYDTTLARMAGNIAGNLATMRAFTWKPESLAKESVAIARAIVAEVKRTTPATEGRE